MLLDLLSGFGEGYQEHRAAEREKAAKAEEREFNLLLSIARDSQDPELKSMAAASLLSLAEGGGRKPKKGFRGWLGEVEQSPYLQPIRQALSPPAVPGGAALPSKAPVEPGAPPMNVAAMQGPAEPIASEAPRPFLSSAPPDPLASTGAPARIPGPRTGGLGAGMPAPAPPQPKIRTMFPDAHTTAALTTAGQIAAKQQEIQKFGEALGRSPDEIWDTFAASQGNPQRAERMTPIELKINGQWTSGFASPTGKYYVGGQEVQPEDTRSATAMDPRAPALLRSTDDEGNLHLIDPVTKQVVQTIPGVGKPQIQAPAFSAFPTFETPTGQRIIGGVPRGGGQPVPLGQAPTPNAVDDDRARAQALIKQIDDLVKVRTAINPRTRRRAIEPTPAYYDQVAEEVTGRKGTRYQELAARAKGAKGAPATGITREGLQTLLETLNQYAQPTAPPTGGVQGSGVPAPPPPPKR